MHGLPSTKSSLRPSTLRPSVCRSGRRCARSRSLNADRPGLASLGQCHHDPLEGPTARPVPRSASEPRFPAGCSLAPGIRNFVVNFIIEIARSDVRLQTERNVLNKMNLVLVSILKQEWPHNWPNFINEIVSASHTSLSICENNMIILRLLSEEVFDYSEDQMTSTKRRELKQTMCDEFTSIFHLCMEVLKTATQASLIKTTLETLLRFLNWIPLGYIFEAPGDISLLELLRNRFLNVPDFRNVTLKCMTEVAGMHTEHQYSELLARMFTETLTIISEIISLTLDLKSTYANSSNKDQEFVQNLALFLTNFFSTHINVRDHSWPRWS